MGMVAFPSFDIPALLAVPVAVVLAFRLSKGGWTLPSKSTPISS